MFKHCLNFPESNTFHAPPPFCSNKSLFFRHVENKVISGEIQRILLKNICICTWKFNILRIKIELWMFCISRHVFPGDFYDEITINNTKFSSSFTTPGAPRRTITTWDIISDLPAISSGKLVLLPPGILSQIYQIYLQVNWYYYHLGYYLRFTRYTFR